MCVALTSLPGVSSAFAVSCRTFPLALSTRQALNLSHVLMSINDTSFFPGYLDFGLHVIFDPVWPPRLLPQKWLSPKWLPPVPPRHSYSPLSQAASSLFPLPWPVLKPSSALKLPSDPAHSASNRFCSTNMPSHSLHSTKLPLGAAPCPGPKAPGLLDSADKVASA